jgi:DNA-binding transcriptional regulator GbsR (MarR family)
MTAQEISDAVGCSRQKVSIWGTRVLFKKGLIQIIQINSNNSYFGVDTPS